MTRRISIFDGFLDDFGKMQKKYWTDILAQWTKLCFCLNAQAKSYSNLEGTYVVCIMFLFYRVFHLEMIYFEGQKGQFWLFIWVFKVIISRWDTMYFCTNKNHPAPPPHIVDFSFSVFSWEAQHLLYWNILNLFSHHLHCTVVREGTITKRFERSSNEYEICV